MLYESDGLLGTGDHLVGQFRWQCASDKTPTEEILHFTEIDDFSCMESIYRLGVDYAVAATFREVSTKTLSIVSRNILV